MPSLSSTPTIAPNVTTYEMPPVYESSSYVLGFSPSDMSLSTLSLPQHSILPFPSNILQLVIGLSSIPSLLTHSFIPLLNISSTYSIITSSKVRFSTPKCFAFTIHGVFVLPKPCTYKNSLDVLEWKHATELEIQALLYYGTWEPVLLPEGKSTIGCKWIFIVKLKADKSLQLLNLLLSGSF